MDTLYGKDGYLDTKNVGCMAVKLFIDEFFIQLQIRLI